MSMQLYKQGVLQVPSGGGDPHFANVVLLLDFAGTNGGQDAVDHSNSGHSLTWNGDAQITTAFSQFGSSSLLLDGTGDFISIAEHADFDFGDGDFTVEARVRHTAASGNTEAIYGFFQLSGTNRELDLRRENNDAVRSLISTNGGSSANIILDGNLMGQNTFREVALERSGDTWRIYRGGVVNDTATDSGTVHDSGNGIQLGNNGDGHFMTGNIDEIRVTKGVARYQGAYTPTSEVWPKF